MSRPTANVALVLVGVLGFTGPSGGQSPDIGVAKGDSVVLVVPTRFAAINRSGLGGLNRKFDVDAHMTNGVLQIRDPDDSTWQAEWRTAGFPSVSHFYVSNVKTVTRLAGQLRFIEVTLKRPGLYDYRLFAPADQPQAIRPLLAPLAAADSVRRMAYDSLGARFFTGPLAGFSPSERSLLLTFAHITANGTRIASETFKGVTYLTITLPDDGNTWNNLRVTRSERIGRLIGNQLALLKTFALAAVRHDIIGGLKLTQPSTHGTAPNYLDTRSDRVEAYFPLDVLLKFAEADITSQQLVNQSIILVNGDRVEVDLSTQ